MRKSVYFRILAGALAFIGLGVISQGALAAVIGFTDSSSGMPTLVSPGDTITLNLQGTGFSTTVDAGGFDVTWDPSVLSLMNFSSANPPWDTVSLGPVSAGKIDFVFLGTSGPALGPNFAIGDLSFNVVGSLGSNSLVNLSEACLGCGWFAPGGNPVPDIQYDSGFILVQPTAVPLPAAFFPFVSGILGLLFAGKRMKGAERLN